MDCYAGHAEELHMSVRPGSNVSHASIALRLVLDGAQRQGLTSAVLFLDVKAAYYRVTRQIVVSSQSPRESIERLILYFDMGYTKVDDLMVELSEQTAADEVGVPPELAAVLSEALSSTWFTTVLRNDLYESLAGSRPGDGLADVIFALVFRRLMNKVKNDIMEHFDIHDDYQGEHYKTFSAIPELAPFNSHFRYFWLC